MRVALTIGVVILTLGLSSRPLLSQARDKVPALESIHMIDALVGWAVTREQDDARPGSPSNALVRTINGGIQWRDVTPPFRPQKNRFYGGATSVEVITSLMAWVGSFRTIDGGRTWKAIPAPGFIQSIHFINARDGWMLSYQGARVASLESDVYRSTDGGETWTKVASSRNGVMNKGDVPDVSFGDPHITFLNATTGWITQSSLLPVRGGPAPITKWSNPYVTRDGGHTWRGQTLSLPPRLGSSWVGIQPPKFFTPRQGILPVFYADHDPKTNRAKLPFFVIYVTYDGGTAWRYTTPISVTQRGPLSFADGTHGWLVNGNALYTTSDGGRQWKLIHAASFADTTQLDFVSPLAGWAIRQTSPFLLKTRDGGRTWIPVTYTILR